MNRLTAILFVILIEGLGSLDYLLLDGEGHNPMTENPAHFDSVLIDRLNEAR